MRQGKGVKVEGFGNADRPSWLGPQMNYDLDVAEDQLQDRLQKEARPRAVVAAKG